MQAKFCRLWNFFAARDILFRNSPLRRRRCFPADRFNARCHRGGRPLSFRPFPIG